MGRPISLGIASDTREFSSGVKRGVIEPLEDAAESLDRVERAGDKAGDELEGAFSKAQREVSDFKREQAEAARDMQKRFKQAGDDLGDDVEHGSHRAKAAVGEFNAEAKANFAETASSFDGSMDSVVGGIQGTFGGLAMALGPVGAIGAGIIGAGIGVATGMATAWQEKQDEIRQGFADMYRGAAEEGRAFLTEAEIVAASADIFFDKDKRKAAREDAEALGISVSTIVRAQAGDQEALNEVVGRTRELYGKAAEEIQANADGLSYTGGAAERTAGKIMEIRERYELIRGAQDEVQQAAQDFLATGSVTESQTSRINALVQARIDKINAASPNKTIRLDINDEDAQKKIDALMKRQYEINVGVRYANGKPVLQ